MLKQELRDRPMLKQELRDRPMLKQEPRDRPMLKQELRNRTTLKQVLKRVLERFGYSVRRIGIQDKYGLDCMFTVLKRLDFQPRHIVDVGANHGVWTRKAFGYFPDACFTLVEPQAHLRNSVQDLIDRGCQLRWIHAGAGDAEALLPFTISSRDDSSSFVPSEAGENSVSVRVRTLNEIVSSGDTFSVAPDMVKIDAEGFDLKVLAGATDLLGKAEIFLVEVLICASSGYSNDILTVIQKMSDFGYKVFDVTDLNRSPRHQVLWLCELAFIKKDSRLLNALVSYE